MQSDAANVQANQDPQVSTLTHTNIKPEVPQMPSLSPQYGNPVAQEILKGLRAADNPIDFIKNNLKTRDSSVNPQQISDQMAQARVSSAPNPPPSDPTPPPSVPPASDQNTTILEPPDPFAPPPQEDAPQGDVPPPDDDIPDDALAADADKPTIQTNYKNLLKVHRETKKTLKQLEEEKTQLQTKLQKIDTGEEIPDVVRKLEERIQTLEPLEALVDLKKSPAYHSKFVEPLNKVTTKILEIAKDYEIPDAVMQEALDITNRAELNRFLLNHFDEVGALEVKQLVTEAQKIKEGAASAEAQPKQSLEAITREHAAIQQMRDAERVQTIANNSRSAWDRAVIRIQKEGRVKELTPRHNDSQFNDTYVRPIMQRAASEYGRMVRTLAESGLESLPDDLAEAIANSCLLSIASAVAVERANATEDYANQLYQNTQRRNGMLRPSMGQIGSQGAEGSGQPAAKPDSPLEAGRLLVNRVLSNSR